MRQTKIVSISLPNDQAKRLGYLARVSRKARSEIVQEALDSYQLQTGYIAGEKAWDDLESIGRALATKVKKGSLNRALQVDRNS